MRKNTCIATWHTVADGDHGLLVGDGLLHCSRILLFSELATGLGVAGGSRQQCVVSVHGAEDPLGVLGALSAIMLAPQLVKSAFKLFAVEDVIAPRGVVPLERSALGADLLHDQRRCQDRELGGLCR
jgi:hypothetical protein